MIDGEELIERLEEASVVTENEAGELQLAVAFERAWYEQIEHVRETDRLLDHLSKLLESEPEAVSIREEGEGTLVVTADGEEIGGWPSEAAMLADVALHPLLEARVPIWSELGGDLRAELLARMTVFLEQCPDCEGRLAASEELQSAVGPKLISVECSDCGALLFEGTSPGGL